MTNYFEQMMSEQIEAIACEAIKELFMEEFKMIASEIEGDKREKINVLISMKEAMVKVCDDEIIRLGGGK